MAMNGALKSSTTASTTAAAADKKMDRSSARARRKSRKTYVGWAVDKSAKLLIWLSILTVLFRCPASSGDLTDASPVLCKPYFHARDYIAPYAQPYYDQYLSPYVQQAQPYVDRVYKPTLATYEKHAAPRVAQAQRYGEHQWERTLKPQLQVLQKHAGDHYNSRLAPHVKKAQDVVQPYYDSVRTSATDIWELELEPVYRKSQPYVEQAYRHGHRFAVNTALPHAQYAGNVTWTVWTRQIWPRLRILYGENVEPQLLRITERLGRYKDGKKLEAEIKSMEKSSKLSEASISASSIASSISSTVKEAAGTPSSDASVSASASPEHTPDPKVQFKEDLKNWGQICATAVQEGSEDLRERIQDITDSQIKSCSGVGGALVTQLEETSDSAISGVKIRIQQIVGQVPEDADESAIETANEDLVQGIRAAGQSVKHRAQAVREWRQISQSDTEDLVAKALESTLETIDSIRELRLTEIGRKYASSSLPHKEWAKYNDLKKAAPTWRNDVENAARKHPGVANVKAASDDIEHQAMAIAEDAAKELARLKDVGKWKIAAQDASDDFETKYISPPIRKVKDQIVEKIAEASEAVFGEEVAQGTVESVTSVIVERASQVATGVSEAVVESSTGSMESVSSKVVENVASLSEKVVGSSRGSVESAASQAADSVKKAAAVASQAIMGSEPGLSDSATDVASAISSAVLGTPSGVSDSATDLASSASSAIFGTESGLSDSATDVVSSISSKVADKANTISINTKLSSILSNQKSNEAASASSSVKSAASEASKMASSVAEDVAGSSPAVSKISASASSAASAVSAALPDADDIVSAAKGAAEAATEHPKKVFAGANAQVLVEAREPIMDDVVDTADSYSEIIQSMANVAGDKASELTKAVQDALNAATSTQDTVGSVTSLAREQYESAMSAASSVLFGTQNAVEKGSSAAREQYLSAVAAASHAIYGTPVTAAPFAYASSAYDSAVSEASRHYEAVKSRISEQVASTPQPVHEQMYSSAESAYAGAIAAANQRLQAVFGSPTQNAFDSISSVASSRLAEGVSAAAAQYTSAKIAIGVEPTSVHQQYVASAQKAYYEALGVAHGRYSEFLEAASSVVGATPTPTGISASFENAISAARETYSAYIADASSRYNEMVRARTASGSVLDQINKQLADASSSASEKLAQASSDVSVAVYGSETPVAESLASRASENWDALISRASEQIYGSPPPFTQVAYSRANEYVAQATEAAAAQWVAVNNLFSELVSGKEPDFTESVYSRLQSAYSTGAPSLASQASSYASDAYASAVSVVSVAFIPPTQVPGIVEQMQSQMNAVVEAASANVYGSSKGAYEQATEDAASMYSDASSQVVQVIYSNTKRDYAATAQAQVALIRASASAAIQSAVYGSSTGNVEAATSAAASVYSSVASQAAEQASAASAAVSSALYGEEQTYYESVQSQLSDAMASASSRISELGVNAASAVEQAASTVSSAVSSATDRVRDEL